MKNELISMCRLYAVSPIHAGSGTATTTVDLPIQREKHTNWPHVQASSVKGAFREHFRLYYPNYLENINQIFGSDEQDNWGSDKPSYPSQVVFSDAKLLAFPVRSNHTPFVHVTCPAVLKRLVDDLALGGDSLDLNFPEFSENEFVVINGEFDKQMILEDVLLKQHSQKFGFTHPLIQDLEKLVLVSDAVYKYLVQSGTEIQTQIKIDHKTGTTQDGSLRYQELLPQDSVLYILTIFGPVLETNELKAEQIKKFIQKTTEKFIRIGGDATLGRGLCKVQWLDLKNGGGN